MEGLAYTFPRVYLFRHSCIKNLTFTYIHIITTLIYMMLSIFSSSLLSLMMRFLKISFLKYVKDLSFNFHGANLQTIFKTNKFFVIFFPFFWSGPWFEQELEIMRLKCCHYTNPLCKYFFIKELRCKYINNFLILQIFLHFFFQKVQISYS